MEEIIIAQQKYEDFLQKLNAMQIGQLFNNRYQIQQLLSKRPGRQIVLALDVETQASVVVKLLFFGFGLDWEDLKLFEREVETLKALDHPSIPRYLNYFELEEQNVKGFALVQTYIDARSLEEQLKSGRTFSEDEIKQLARSLLEILVYLHQKHPPLLHRDIKPSNILLTNRSGNNVGQVYLVDFGSVQTLAPQEGRTFTIVGTSGYTPIEQYVGQSSPASDLYALGATLIYLATGKHPTDLLQKDGRIQFESFAYLSPVFTNWLKQMVEPSLDKRLACSNKALKDLVDLDKQSACSDEALQDLHSESERDLSLMQLLSLDDSDEDLDLNVRIGRAIKLSFGAAVTITVVAGFVRWALPELQGMLQILIQGLKLGQHNEIISTLLLWFSVFKIVGCFIFFFGIGLALHEYRRGGDPSSIFVQAASIFLALFSVDFIFRFLLKV